MEQPVPFHPEWLVTFWKTTPVIKNLDPHVTSSIIFFIVLGIGLFYTAKAIRPKQDDAEVQFQHLLQKRRIVEEQIEQLKDTFAKEEITEKDYKEKLNDLETYLKKVKEELLDYT